MSTGAFDNSVQLRKNPLIVSKDSINPLAVHTGCLTRDAQFSHAFLLAQHWPTCHLILESLQLETLQGSVVEKSPDFHYYWFGTDTCWGDNTFEPWLESHSNDVASLVCLQGTPLFVQRHISLLETAKFRGSFVFFSRVTRKGLTPSWNGSSIRIKTISHADQGGATASRWLFGFVQSGTALNLHISPHPIKRNISHFVDPVSKGLTNWDKDV